MPESDAAKHRRDIQGLRAVAVLLVVFGHAGVPIGWLRYQDRCPMVIGHTIAYSDTNHISAIYSAQLAGAFRAAFRSAIDAGAGRRT